MRNQTVALAFIVLSISFSLGLVIGSTAILTRPFEYGDPTISSYSVCRGDFVLVDVTVITYYPTVTKVVREWEQIGGGWYRPAGSFDVVVESNRKPWQFWIEPDISTFPELIKVPNDAPLGIVQFQQGAHSGLTWDEVFTIDVEVIDCEDYK